MWHGVVVSHASTTSTLAINIGFALPGGLVITAFGNFSDISIGTEIRHIFVLHLDLVSREQVT